MRNSQQQPPKYGAEGPPGGVEAWNQQRFAQTQGKDMPKMFQRLGGAIAGMNPEWAQNRAAAMQARSQPQPWSQVPRMQWPGQGGAAPSPQGQPPQAQMPGTPPQMPQSSVGWAGMQLPQQSQASQAAGQPQLPQQTGMAGLGQAAGRGMQMLRANALRRGGGRMQEQ